MWEKGMGLSLQKKGGRVAVGGGKGDPKREVCGTGQERNGKNEKPMELEDWEDSGKPWATEEWTRVNKP